MKAEIARILTEEGFAEGYGVTDEAANLVIRLKYTGRGEPVITGLDRVSKPGRRTYTGYRDIPWVRSGLGVSIVSTPKGPYDGPASAPEGRRRDYLQRLVRRVWFRQ